MAVQHTQESVRGVHDSNHIIIQNLSAYSSLGLRLGVVSRDSPLCSYPWKWLALRKLSGLVRKTKLGLWARAKDSVGANQSQVRDNYIMWVCVFPWLYDSQLHTRPGMGRGRMEWGRNSLKSGTGTSRCTWWCPLLTVSTHADLAVMTRPTAVLSTHSHMLYIYSQHLIQEITTVTA